MTKSKEDKRDDLFQKRLKEDERFRKAYEALDGKPLKYMIPEEMMEEASGGNGRWFIADDRDVGVCDACRIYGGDPNYFCPDCGKPYRTIKGRDIPDDYTFDAWKRF